MIFYHVTRNKNIKNFIISYISLHFIKIYICFSLTFFKKKELFIKLNFKLINSNIFYLSQEKKKKNRNKNRIEKVNNLYCLINYI